MRNLAFGRLFGLSLAVISLVGAVVFGVAAYRYNVMVHRWNLARPMETRVDLSQPGSLSVPFHQTCSISHGEGVFLDCEIRDEAGQIPDEVLKGLAGSLVITDSAGNEIANRDLTEWKTPPPGQPIVSRYLVSGEVMLTEIPTFKTGAYTATVTIDEGAPALADHTQTIYAKYRLCGMEQMPVAVFGFFAFCAGVVFLIAGLVVIPNFCRFGIWKHQTAEEVLTEAPQDETDPPGEWFV
ncbi:hypothetical protein Pan241w_22770 [Gimesia alba]|uniref:Uncharacterized protein n=1 Tax=Gimesia alba TaxID=2527973 RepID=A0A517REA4_9PLAN|nr:hypothetical protein [Gimesia alba]QDT42196.1 hypothetical protein Pan241w_22770 [Gimesia alba]